MSFKSKNLNTSHFTRQNGIALIVIFFILALAATAVTITSYSIREELIQTTNFNLREAKIALIARAINDSSRPGSLPCPDVDGDGQAESAMLNGGQCPSYVGLLPWQTLDLPDIRDTSGQRFWYVLSPNFRDDDTAYPINSQTAPQINLDNQVEKLMALVIAPGAPLDGQSRSGSFTIPASISNYLDGANGDNDTNMIFTAQPASSNFNDQLIEIRRDDIFPQVERLALVEVRNNLQSYYSVKWQRFPFAAGWSDTSEFPIGVANLIGGRLPLGTGSNNLSWGGSISPALYCSINATSGPTCNFSLPLGGSVSVTISFKINGVGLGFFEPLSLSDITSSGSAQFTAQSIQPVMDSGGNVTYTVNGTVSGGLLSSVAVKVNKPSKTNYWDKDTSSSWVWKNGWDRYIYYRVGASDMTNDCATQNLCLTINTTSNATNDNPALLMMAGRPLDSTVITPSSAQTRPSATLSDYFDTANNTSSSNLATTLTATTANRQFDSRFKPSANANDQAVGVKP